MENTLMSTAVVNPIKKGANLRAAGQALPVVDEGEYDQHEDAVPYPCTNAAAQEEINATASSPAQTMAGLGKYSPNTIADTWLPGAPLITPSWVS